MTGIFASIVVIFLIVPFAYLWESSVCETRAQRMGFRSDYGFMQGCMIRVKDRWVPIESYRVVGEEP